MNQDTELYKLNLPAPSDTIKNIMYEIYKAHFVTQTGVAPIVAGDRVRADHLLNVSGTYEHLELSRQVRKEYAEYFPGIEISGYFSFFRGDYEQSGLAKRYYPHVDTTRCATINYYFETGGPDVQTCFYDFFDEDPNRTSAIVFFRDTPAKLGYTVFQPESWYMFDGGIQAHSVENILGLRMYLGIMLLRNDSEKIKMYDDQSITSEYITNSTKTLERSPYKCSDVLTKMDQVNLDYTKLNITT